MFSFWIHHYDRFKICLTFADLYLIFNVTVLYLSPTAKGLKMTSLE